jgi:hypothetical protein
MENADTQLTYLLDEVCGNTAVDSSPKHHDGLMSGGVWVPGHTGNALRFSDVEGTVSCADNVDLDITKALKISFWIFLYPMDCDHGKIPVPCFRSVIAKGDSYGIYLRQDPPPEGQITMPWVLHFYTRGNSNPSITTEDLTGATEYLFGAWNHLEFTFDGGVKKLFINGVLCGYQPSHASRSATQAGMNIFPNTSPFTIGCKEGMSGFQGMIDEVRIYNKPTIEAERLVVDEDHKLYFKNVIKIDGNWELKDHVFLVGDGQRDDLYMWQNAANSMNALKYLQTLSEYNLNYSRTDLMNWNVWTGAGPDGCDGCQEEYPNPQCAYRRDYLNPPPAENAYDGCKPFNIRRVSWKMDQNYLNDRLVCFTEYAKHRGIFIEYTLFDAWVLTDSRNFGGWMNSIWNIPPKRQDPPYIFPKNGEMNELEQNDGITDQEIFSDDQAYLGYNDAACNAITVPGDPLATLNARGLCWLWWTQTGLIEVMQAYLGNYDNYIFEICNEMYDYDQPGPVWTGQMVQFITDSYPESSNPPYRKLKSVDRGFLRPGGLEGVYTSWHAEYASDYGYGYCDIVDMHMNPSVDDLTKLDRMHGMLTDLDRGSNPTKPRINNENYNPMETADPVWTSKVAWTTYMSGAHYQRHFCSWRDGVIPAGDLSAFEALKKFVHSTHFWELEPETTGLFSVTNPVNSGVFGMVNPYEEYVVYVVTTGTGQPPAGTKLQLPINPPRRTCFKAEWYYPIDGIDGIGSFSDPFYLEFPNSPVLAIELPPDFSGHIALHLIRMDCPN